MTAIEVGARRLIDVGGRVVAVEAVNTAGTAECDVTSGVDAAAVLALGAAFAPPAFLFMSVSVAGAGAVALAAPTAAGSDAVLRGGGGGFALALAIELGRGKASDANSAPVDDGANAVAGAGAGAGAGADDVALAALGPFRVSDGMVIPSRLRSAAR